MIECVCFKILDNRLYFVSGQRKMKEQNVVMEKESFTGYSRTFFLEPAYFISKLRS